MEGTKNGKGRHHQALISNVSLINLNGLKPFEPKNIVEDELEVIGIYLNSKSSSMSFKKNLDGSMALASTGFQKKLDADTAKSLLMREKIHGAYPKPQLMTSE